jgi:hypothetical protein
MSPSETNGIRRIHCYLAYGSFAKTSEAPFGLGPCFLCQVWLTPMPDETLPTVIACVSFGLN